MLAERYQRSFLRLLTAFRETRRLVGTLVVAGGQVNVSERQFNVAGGGPATGAGERSRRPMRSHSRGVRPSKEQRRG